MHTELFLSSSFHAEATNCINVVLMDVIMGKPGTSAGENPLTRGAVPSIYSPASNMYLPPDQLYRMSASRGPSQCLPFPCGPQGLQPVLHGRPALGQYGPYGSPDMMRPQFQGHVGALPGGHSTTPPGNHLCQVKHICPVK